MDIDIDFCNYSEALALKELGFDEPCLAYYESQDKNLVINYNNLPLMTEEQKKRPGLYTTDNRNSVLPQWAISTPTFSQAFRWFREKYKLHHVIHQFNFKKNTGEEYLAEVDKTEDGFEYFRTYEECEYFCLRKLIEIVKENDNI